ncbi:MAG: hypothetical protein ABWW65_07435 [Thermoprotei archaeon]
MSIKVVIDLAKSPHVSLSRDKALDLLACIEEKIGGSKDLSEATRIINSFDEYYRVSRKRFEEYITPPKDPGEVLMGKAVVHKLRLFVENDSKNVELIFDRRFDISVLEDCLKAIGFNEIIIEKQLF